MSALKELFRVLVLAVITAEAKAVLRKYRPHVILITGSVGKTSSKDALYTALSPQYFVRKSEKGYNSDIGVPLTILGVPNGWSNPAQWIKNIFEGMTLILLNAPYPKWLILEIGADRPGDITKSLSWLDPDVVVATRFPDISVHVEYYSSPKEVNQEELAPAGWLKDGGVYIFNADDENAPRAITHQGVTRVSYGFSKTATVRGSRFHISSKDHVPTGISFSVSARDEKATVTLPGVVGATHAYATLAGISAAWALGVSLEKCAQAFSSHLPPRGRMRIIEGVKGTAIIDDTYNASPIATEEALLTLKEIPRMGKRIAILADMLELGPYSLGEHRRIGELAAESTDILITSGIRARNIADAARESGLPENQVKECERGADAASYALSIVEPGDVILVKGSQSMRMERVVKSLMKEPEKAGELLVRQEAEWLAR